MSPPAAGVATVHSLWSSQWPWLPLVAAAGTAIVLLALPTPSHARLLLLLGGPPRGGSPWREAARGLRGRLDALRGRPRERRRDAVVELCRVLAAELSAGRTPLDALTTAIAELEPDLASELSEVTAAARGGDTPEPALRRASARPGAGGLGYLAACWGVAAGTGGGLADVVRRLAETLARDQAHRRELSAQLTGPRTTAALLAFLPLLGIAMAGALGTQPLAFLFTTPVGIACLLLGLALDAVGLYWTLRMVRHALRELEPHPGPEESPSP